MGGRFVDGAGGFSFHARQQARENLVEPGMLMKIKQVSEESKRCHGRFQKTKCLKLNVSSIAIVGYHSTGKR